MDLSCATPRAEWRIEVREGKDISHLRMGRSYRRYWKAGTGFVGNDQSILALKVWWWDKASPNPPLDQS